VALAKVDFLTEVYPILEARCIECHGAEKDKGDLRLDLKEYAFASDYVLIPGNAVDSEFHFRITLPSDDPDSMPSRGDPLTADEIAILEEWINEGAEWTDPSLEVDFERQIAPILADLDPDRRELLLQWIEEGAKMPELVEEDPYADGFPISDAETAAVAQLQEKGVVVVRLGQNLNWLRANFRVAGKDIGDEDLALLADMPNLAQVDASATQMTNDGLAHLSGLARLVRLNLNSTGVSDDGLPHIAGLNNLVYLNLYGTQVTDAGLKHLEGLTKLEKLYLWQSKVTAAGAKALNAALPNVEINLGPTNFLASPEAEKKIAEEAS
jgi:hypothetical protein